MYTGNSYRLSETFSILIATLYSYNAMMTSVINLFLSSKIIIIKI